MRATAPTGLGPAAEAAALAIAIDASASEAVDALGRSEVPSVLLKGASLAGWLFGDEPRPYCDIDLLIAPDDVARAAPVLAGLGYVPRGEMFVPKHTDHAEWWVREHDAMNLDLHLTLVGAAAPPDKVWDELSRATEPMLVGGREVTVLSPPGRAMHVALHAAEHGRDEPKTLEDLRRALERVPQETWAEAAELANRIEAVEAFAAGLRLLPEGTARARRLNLPAEIGVDTALHAASAPYSAYFVKRLAATPGTAAKLRMIRSKVLADREFMRAWYPIARRGPLGLALAYVWREVWLVWRGVPAVLAWARAKREASRRG
jgi:hypothetical protein